VEKWQRAHATGQPWEDTFPLRGRDGTYRWFLSRVVPICDEASAVVRWFGTNTDITEMMKVETALRYSEERYRTLYESIDEGFCVIHVLFDEDQTPVDYVFLEVNPAFEKQTGLHSARGRRMREIAPKHEQHWFDLYGHIAITGEPRRFEYPAMQLHRWYEGYAYRFGKPHERKVGIIFNDITERKASQARVERFAEELERQVAERTFELVASQEQLRALTTELNLTEARERMRLATELHDYLAQMLVLAGMKLDQAKQSPPARSSDFMNQADEVLSKCLSYTRTLVAELSPPVLHEFGLPAALRWLGEQMGRYKLAVTVLIHTAEDIELPEDQAILLFQSVRELLLNTSKHARSDHASLVLDHVDGRLRIMVQDNGVGFDLAAAAAAAAAL
jgi:PAS domain S-box-containing protein